MQTPAFIRQHSRRLLVATGIVLVVLVAISSVVYVLAIRGDSASGGGDAVASTIYVADTGHNAIQTLDEAGNQLDRWFFQPGDPLAFDQPAAVLIGGDGVIYVADADNGVIRLFDDAGAEIDVWGRLGSEPGEFRGPRALAADSRGNVYVVDTLNGRIQKFSPDGDLLLIWGERGSAPGQFVQPRGIAIDDDDRIYIADHQNDRIQVFDDDGSFLYQWGQETDPPAALDHPESVTIDANNVYVTDWNHRVARFDLSGNYLNQWGVYGEGDAEFRYPAGLAHDDCGNVWVADWGNHRLQLFDDEGAHLATVGESLWFEATFAYPSGIAIAHNGGSGCGELPISPAGEDGAAAATELPEPTGPAKLGPDGHYTEIQVTSNGTQHLIPLAEIEYGAPRDGIPAISSPVFAGPDQWESEPYWEDSLVVGVEVDGKWRAYPFQILVQHEIVNDVFVGQPLLVSYCPLCGSAIVFERDLDIDEELVTFGVSGQLYNSDLLMYDRKTATLWSQITGTAVVGELTGMRLPVYPSQVMTVADWKASHPDSEILSTTTYPGRVYTFNPYGDYANDPSLMFGVSNQDSRLHLKERVTGVELDGQIYGAYPDEQVQEHSPINDILDDVPLLVAADPGAGGNVVVFDRRVAGRELTFSADGAVLVDDETGSSWTYQGLAIDGELAGEQLTEILPVKGFWFGWYAFHPSTALWTAGD